MFVPLLLVVLLSQPTYARSPQVPLRTPFSVQPSLLLKDPSFSQLVDDTLAEWHVPGLALAVVDGGVVHAKGFGIATFPDTVVTPSTLFGAGSTTKSHTAAALSFLVDDDENFPGLNWDTHIADVIRDDFVLPDEWTTNHMNFIDALSHQTGMPRHDMSYGYPNATQGDVTRALRYLPMTREPRTTFQYCNMMFAVIGHVIETLTGGRLGDFLRSKLWEPLSMYSTFLYIQEAQDFVASNQSAQIATPYRWIPEATESDEKEHGHFSAEAIESLDAVAGAGAILTTVEDYAKYLRAMLFESQPLSRLAYKELKTPRSISKSISASSPYTGSDLYSLGWQYSVYKGHPIWSHGGSTIGYGADMRYFPQDNWAMVCLANTMGTSNTVCNIILGHVLEEHYQVRSDEKFDWVGTAREAAKKEKADLDLKEAKARLYPEVTRIHPPGPLAPLARHEGTYIHPAYQTANVTVRTARSGRAYLHAAMSPRTFSVQIDLTHVSGEWFLLESGLPWPRTEIERSPEQYPYGDGGSTDRVARALFMVGPDGRANRLGMEMDDLMVETAEREHRPREEGMIWFDRST